MSQATSVGALLAAARALTAQYHHEAPTDCSLPPGEQLDELARAVDRVEADLHTDPEPVRVRVTVHPERTAVGLALADLEGTYCAIPDEANGYVLDLSLPVATVAQTLVAYSAEADERHDDPAPGAELAS